MDLKPRLRNSLDVCLLLMPLLYVMPFSFCIVYAVVPASPGVVAATVAAQPVEDTCVSVEGEPLLARGLLLEALIVWVLDRDAPAAPLADHLAGLVAHGFVVGDAIPFVDAAGYTGAVKVLDRSVYGGPADRCVHVLRFQKQLLGADPFLLTHENLHNKKTLLGQPEVVLHQIIFERFECFLHLFFWLDSVFRGKKQPQLTFILMSPSEMPV